MSVLARPQGTPERVWSYVAGLAALGGRAPRAEVEGLFNPGFLRDGLKVQTKPELAGDTFGAATSLEIVRADRSEVWLDETLQVESSGALADVVHDRLCAPEPGDKNGVILEAYAWLAAQSDKEGGLGWIYDWTREDFADRANDALVGEEDGGRLMNTTKVPAWRRWLGFLGLSISLPLTNAPDYPLPSARTARELQRAGLKAGEEMPVARFLAIVQERQPYLDGGRLFRQACDRIGHTARPRRLSPLMSAGLRALHDQGAVQLRPRGDSAESVALSGDTVYPIQSIHTVRIAALEAST
jgi:hypothetical protein